MRPGYADQRTKFPASRPRKRRHCHTQELPSQSAASSSTTGTLRAKGQDLDDESSSASSPFKSSRPTCGKREVEQVQALTTSDDPDLAAKAKEWLADDRSGEFSEETLLDRVMDMSIQHFVREDKKASGWRKSWEEKAIDETDVASSSKDPFIGKGKGRA